MFVLQGDVMKHGTLNPICRGGTDRMIAKRDQENLSDRNR